MLPETDPQQAQYNLYCDMYGVPAVDAFVAEWTIANIEYFEDSYLGTYSSKQEFIESRYEEDTPLPTWVSIDYLDFWENLSKYYIYSDASNAVFLRDW